MENIKEYVKRNTVLMYGTLRELCAIPAPSHMEQARAAYCKAWLKKAGAKEVYVDEALNAVLPINCEGSDAITVFVAHTDTVFPDTDPMPYSDDGEIIRCPGVGDDTASLTVLLLTAKYFIEQNVRPAGGVLFVCNSCEEGLGNLKGTRQIFKDFDGRIARFVSYDSKLGHLTNRCVGSHRYEVEALTVGGHSWGAFGNPNAIAALSRVVEEIYRIDVPHVGNSRTTYNVGIIDGGTSVNTIAQSARMLCEYRSDSMECLAIMKKHFERIFSEVAAYDGVELRVTLVGERPCMGDVDLEQIARMETVCAVIQERATGKSVTCGAGSTDCNIPLSLGVPAICVGVYEGGGAHTREEWIKRDSLVTGLAAGIETALALSEEI
ncbi:MAG: M20/M25/M40 family metallo-hydrolase [Clostridia bacterium]|nr:M20/M25/M40 family metallo-hydrolase [Clostridia bacterium]